MSFVKDFFEENYSLIINKNNIEINVHKEKKWKKFFFHIVKKIIAQTLRLYDFFQKEYILIKNLGNSATYISFSPDCKLLAIGTIYGKVMIINVEIVVDKTDSRNLVYQVQKLDPIQFIKYELGSINSNKNNINNSN